MQDQSQYLVLSFALSSLLPSSRSLFLCPPSLIHLIRPMPHLPMLKNIPFDLPELCGPISKHLNTGDLVRCVLVCRTWNTYFSPWLWNTIFLNYGRHRDPGIEVTTKNRRYIKNLGFNGIVNKAFAALTYPNVSSLYLGHNRNISTDPLSAAGCLVSLKLEHVRVQKPRAFWAAVSKLPGIRQLQLKGLYLEHEALEPFWNVCTQLENLQVLQGSMDASLAKSRDFRRMTSLAILNVACIQPKDASEWFMKCPNLKELWIRPVLGAPGGTVPFPSTASLPNSGAWPLLEVLRLDDRPITDDDLSKLISNMSRKPRVIRVGGSDFAKLSFETLRPLFGGLQRLDLPNVIKTRNSARMVHTILCYNPQLQVLNACRIKAIDLLQEHEPWVCGRSLRLLKIHFEFPMNDDDDKADFQRPIFKRLATLRALEELDVTGRYRLENKSDEDALDFRLKSGLGELATLKYLRSVSFERTRQQLEDEDVAWIAKHWQGLRTLRGLWNEDPTTLRRLQGILRF